MTYSTLLFLFISAAVISLSVFPLTPRKEQRQLNRPPRSGPNFSPFIGSGLFPWMSPSTHHRDDHHHHHHRRPSMKQKWNTTISSSCCLIQYNDGQNNNITSLYRYFIRCFSSKTLSSSRPAALLNSFNTSWREKKKSRVHTFAKHQLI
jgi:hypothetical protein